MITAEPDITRLLARLKAQKMVSQRRDNEDRRVVWTQITEAGLGLLAEMDATVEAAPRQLLGHLSQEQLRALIELLELARAGCPEAQSGGKQTAAPAPECPSARPTCEGK
jgi:DNA-binding MarR family transcriptional regulator